MSQVFARGGQSIGVSALASVLLMDIQDLLPLGLTGWVSLQSKGLSRVFKSINYSVLSFLYSPTLTNNMVYAEQLLTLSSWESGILVHARQTVFIWLASNNSLGHSVSNELLWLTTSHKYCHNSLVEELGASYDLYKEPGELQSIGLQRVGHDSSDWACTHDLHDSTGRKLLEVCNSFPLSFVWCIFSLCWFYFASFQWNKS